MTQPSIITALTEFEARTAGAVPSPRRFRVALPWMLSAHLLPATLRSALMFAPSPVPGLQFKHIFALVVGGGKKWDIALPHNMASTADALQIKASMTRIRAFYLPQGAMAGRCIKIVCAKDGIADRTRQELALRQRLQDMGTITVPRVLSVEENESFIVIVEEFIHGRRFNLRRDMKKYIREGLPQLAATYQKNRLRQEPLTAHFPPDLPHKLRQAVPGNPVVERLATVLSADMSDDPAIPACLCHGDLLPSNLCISGDRLYFFDWEKSYDGAAVSDLLRLPMKYPGRADAVVDAVAEILVRGLGASPAGLAAQISAYVAQRIVQAPENAPAYLAFWQRHFPRWSARRA